MSRMSLLSVVLCVIAAAVGCGSSGDSSSTSAVSGSTDDPVTHTVNVFLEAIRTGDTEVSSSLLTPLALERILENDMSFAPPASEKASFSVGKVEMFEADKAAVDTVWIDTDADGVPTNEQMTWALKLTDGQWRVSGLIAYLEEGRPPIVIDFENPDRLFGSSPQRTAKQQTEPQQQQPAPTRQASQPTQDPFR